MNEHVKFIMVVDSDCEPCIEAVEKIKGNVRFELLDIRKDEGARALLEKLEVTNVPVVLIVNEQLNKICAMTEDKKPKCVDYKEAAEDAASMDL